MQQGMANSDVGHLGDVARRMAYKAAENRLRQMKLLDTLTSSASAVSWQLNAGNT